MYGRRATAVIVKDGRPRKRQGRVLPLEQARVFIQDHHPSYIDWVQYEAHQKTLQRNAGNFDPETSFTAVRAGHGLLTGLLRCARCGRKLHIRYWGRRGTAARYLCHGDFGSGGKYCLGFGGATVDQRVSVEILKALAPLALNASVAALEQCQDQQADQRNALLRQRQQMEYEVQRAFAQYDQVDPSNRLVAQVPGRHPTDRRAERGGTGRSARLRAFHRRQQSARHPRRDGEQIRRRFWLAEFRAAFARHELYVLDNGNAGQRGVRLPLQF